jgi:hypothetical protein
MIDGGMHFVRNFRRKDNYEGVDSILNLTNQTLPQPLLRLSLSPSTDISLT